MEAKKLLEFVVTKSIAKASGVLSKILRAGAKIELEDVRFVDISEATEEIMREEDREVVGSMLSLKGEISCKILFLIKHSDAFIITDLMLQNELGTTSVLNEFAESAVMEIGNILSGSIANTFAGMFDIALWQSTPLLLNDFLGVVLSNFVMEAAPGEDLIWLIRTKFFIVRTKIECEMFLIPQSNILNFLNNLSNQEGAK